MFCYRISDDTELRLIEPRHAEELYALIDRNRAHLGRWLSWAARVQSADDIKQYAKNALNRFAADGSPLCGIWRNGMLVGTIDMLGIHGGSRCTEIGYWLSEEHQGQGLVTRACHTLVSHAFNALDVNRVEIRAEPRNTRSRAVAERLGFTEEGTLRQVINMGDRYDDRAVYAMLREDWLDTQTRLRFAYPLTGDTELRVFEEGRVETLYALVDANREHLRRWLPWVDSTRFPQDIEAFRQRTLRSFAENGSFNAYIWHQGELAGVLGVHDIDWANRRTAIGYWLAESFQGKGIMTKACRAILAHLFGNLGLNRVELHAATENTRSRAVAERLGMRHEGTLRQHGRQADGGYLDMEVYAMLREEWEVPTIAISMVETRNG